MPAKSLQELATKTSIKHIREITDVGDAPYSVVRPTLLKVDNPHQLKLIEANSPQIRGLTGEIWRALIKRDLFLADDAVQPPMDPKNWSSVYTKLKAEAEAKKARAEAALKQQLFASEEEKKAQQITIDNTLIVPGKGKSANTKAKVQKAKPKPKNIRVGNHRNGKEKWVSSEDLMAMYRRQSSANAYYLIGSAVDYEKNGIYNPKYPSLTTKLSDEKNYQLSLRPDPKKVYPQ